MTFQHSIYLHDVEDYDQLPRAGDVVHLERVGGEAAGRVHALAVFYHLTDGTGVDLDTLIRLGETPKWIRVDGERLRPADNSETGELSSSIIHDDTYFRVIDRGAL